MRCIAMPCVALCFAVLYCVVQFLVVSRLSVPLKCHVVSFRFWFPSFLLRLAFALCCAVLVCSVPSRLHFISFHLCFAFLFALLSFSNTLLRFVLTCCCVVSCRVRVESRLVVPCCAV